MKAKANEVELEIEEIKEVKVKIGYESVDSFDDIEFDNDDIKQVYDDVFFVKISGTKRGETAHFKISKKENDVYLTEERTDRKLLSGKVIKIETGEYTYEEKVIKTLKISFLTEKNNIKKLYILNLNYNSLSRTLINCLLSVDQQINKMTIALGKNGGGFNIINVSINGNKGEWKFPISELNQKVEDIKNSKGVVLQKDYTELNEFLEMEIYKKLKTWIPSQDVVKFVEESDTENEEIFGEDEEDIKGFFEIDEE